MKTPTRQLLHTALATAAIAIALPAWSAAGSADKATIESNYRSARSACQSISEPADRTNCLRDAGAARAQALRSGLTPASREQLERNAMQRCQVHKSADDQAICERMARGDGTATGSVERGGMIRELSTPVPASPAPRQ